MRHIEGRLRKDDIHHVGDEFSLRLACSFEITGSEHRLSEFAMDRGLPHDCALCLIFVVQGHLDLDIGGSHLSLGPAEAYLAEPLSSGLVRLSYGTDADFYLVQFRRSRLPARVAQRRIEVPNHVATRNPGRLTDLLRMFMEETRRPCPSRLVLHHLVVLMLCEMASSSLVRGEPRAREDGLESMASRVDAYIAAHYHEPIGTTDIAHELRYNPDYLERAYRAERLMSIRQSIRSRRIREARAQLVLQSARGIAEIAALCGFSDAAYFRRVFKRVTSMTPHGYRTLNAPNRREPQLKETQ
jgi:AraC-like DNA-binding protein